MSRPQNLYNTPYAHSHIVLRYLPKSLTQWQCGKWMIVNTNTMVDLVIPRHFLLIKLARMTWPRKIPHEMMSGQVWAFHLFTTSIKSHTSPYEDKRFIFRWRYTEQIFLPFRFLRRISSFSTCEMRRVQDFKTWPKSQNVGGFVIYPLFLFLCAKSLLTHAFRVFLGPKT